MADDTLRLLHFADLHLGVQSGGRIDPATGLNRRIVDVCDRLDELCATAEDEAVHAVLFAGDAFNNQHPNPTLQSLFAARVRRLARGGTAVFLLIGNHDLPKMASLAHPFTIYEALEVEGVVVGDRAAVYRLPLTGAPAPELQVAALPHFSKSQALERLGGSDEDIRALVATRVRELGTEIDPSLPSVFVGHCHIDKSDVGDGQNHFGISDVEIPLSSLASGQPFPYFALGHIHKRQVLSDAPFVAYPGSLERVDFGEGDVVEVSANGSVSHRAADPKGYYRFDLGGPSWTLADEPSFREVGARRFVTIRLGPLGTDAPLDDIARRIALVRTEGVDLADAFVRISATIAGTDRGRVDPGAVRDLVGDAYDVSVALETSSTTTVRDPRFAHRMSEIEALDRYIETKDEWRDDADELKRLGRELIAEVLSG